MGGRGGTPRWLLFDVFGTLVDWRTGVARKLGEFLKEIGRRDIDPHALADAWRRLYQPAMEEIRSGARPFVKLDILHRENLFTALEATNLDIGAVSDARIDQLALAWHHLPAWPDVALGMAKLRERYLLAPLSNGNVSLLVNLARRNQLPFDAVLGAEITRRYKPDPASYVDTLAILDCAPDEAMLVAAHPSDLAAAAACGMQTAYVHRPLEWGNEQGSPMPSGSWRVAARDLNELAYVLEQG